MKGDYVMTFENALKKIKTEFAKADASKLADMAVQVTMTDEDCGGTFYFKASNGELAVEGYDYRDNDAVIDIARKALMDILAGKTTLDAAIEKGVATAKGDFAKLDTLKDAIAPYKAPAKKAPAKKAPAKKAETKKVVPAKKAEPVKKAEVKVETKKAEPKKVEAKKAEAKPAVKTTKKA
ncbi:MAG: alkyl sulfatase C-terminal domain-containing protein [Clostridiales bacterium]|nr:alkyl sulfatase C-terminal domain-containing protein [Clostridiales bacterium]